MIIDLSFLTLGICKYILTYKHIYKNVYAPLRIIQQMLFGYSSDHPQTPSTFTSMYIPTYRSIRYPAPDQGGIGSNQPALSSTPRRPLFLLYNPKASKEGGVILYMGLHSLRAQLP